MAEPIYDLVTVGASVAGVAAAEEFRRRRPDARILVVDADPSAPYDKPPLSKEYLLGGSESASLRLGTDGFWSTVELRVGCSASAVAQGGLNIAGEHVSTRSCVVATGSSARSLETASGASNATPLRTLADASRLRRLVVGAQSPVIVGAGFIGLEVASALSTLGVAAHVVELRDRPLIDVLGSTVSDWLRAVHESRGVVFHRGKMMVAARRNGAGEIVSVELSDGTSLPCDLLLIGVGAVPNTELLGDVLSDPDGIACDEHLHTEVPGTFAAGDVARFLDLGRGVADRIEHWTNARLQGRHAGSNAARWILGEDLEPFIDVPYVWSDQCGLQLQIVGRPALGRERLQVQGDSDSAGLFSEFMDDNGQVVGAVAVNAPRQLMRLRRELVAIARRQAMQDVHEVRSTVADPTSHSP